MQALPPIEEGKTKQNNNVVRGEHIVPDVQNKQYCSFVEPLHKNTKQSSELLSSFFGKNRKFRFMESNKATWKIKSSDFTHYKEYVQAFPDRGNRKAKAFDFLSHIENKHIIIIYPQPNKTRWFALDIDQKDISETDLVFKLLKIEQDTNLKLYYCRSTGGEGWHIWGFTKHLTPHKELRKITYYIEKELPYKVDKVYPNGKQGITAPFRNVAPLRDISGKEIRCISEVQTNKNINETLSSLRQITESSEDAIEAATDVITSVAEHQQKKYKPMPHEPIPIEIMEALTATENLKEFKRELEELYPLHPSYRHWLCLLVAGDLFKRFDASLKDAIVFIETIASSKGDKEIGDRVQAVKDTYKRFKNGHPIKTTRRYSKEKTLTTCFYTKVTATKKQRGNLKGIVKARVVTALVHNGFFDGDITSKRAISKRLIMGIAGLSDKATLEALKELAKEGILEKRESNNKSYYFVIGVNKNYMHLQDYLIPIESDISEEEKERHETKVARLAKETRDNNIRKEKAKKAYVANLKKKQSPTKELAPTDEINTVIIDVENDKDVSYTSLSKDYPQVPNPLPPREIDTQSRVRTILRV